MGNGNMMANLVATLLVISVTNLLHFHWYIRKPILIKLICSTVSMLINLLCYSDVISLINFHCRRQMNLLFLLIVHESSNRPFSYSFFSFWIQFYLRYLISDTFDSIHRTWLSIFQNTMTTLWFLRYKIRETIHLCLD